MLTSILGGKYHSCTHNQMYQNQKQKVFFIAKSSKCEFTAGGICFGVFGANIKSIKIRIEKQNKMK